MFCRNCGKEIADSAVICVGCGCKPNNGKNYCQNCGATTTKEQEICIKCGAKLVKDSSAKEYAKSLFEGDGSENYNFSRLKPYYQKEFELMHDDPNYKGKFNWAAFFFGPLWLLYNSVFVPALIYLIIVSALTYIFHITGGLFSLVPAIIFGVRGNFLYYNYYTKKKIRIF